MRTKIVKQAQTWLGCRESDGTHKPIIDTYNTIKPLPRGYAVRYTDEWCATFVSAVAKVCGALDVIPAECSCSKMIEGFKSLGSWQENDGYLPMPGDILFYDWQDSGKGDNTGSPDHVGIVENVSNGKITIIEGNKGEAVSRRYLQINDRYIRGYGLPKYITTTNKELTTEELDQMARDVINGKYGTGTDRKTALGANYNAVQARVNEMLKSKSVETVAREVISGKWGNGADRKQKLMAAGYDYNAVQSVVNKLLK